MLLENYYTCVPPPTTHTALKNVTFCMVKCLLLLQSFYNYIMDLRIFKGLEKEKEGNLNQLPSLTL